MQAKSINQHSDEFRFLEIMKNTVVGLTILITLLVGIIIGLVISPRGEIVYAQQKPAAPPCVTSSDTECVSPIMTVGSAGIGTLLANHVSTDQLTVNGYDVLKLQNNILSALVRGKVLTQDGAKAIVESSHPDKYIRYQPSVPPPTSSGLTPKP